MAYTLLFHGLEIICCFILNFYKDITSQDGNKFLQPFLKCDWILSDFYVMTAIQKKCLREINKHVAIFASILPFTYFSPFLPGVNTSEPRRSSEHGSLHSCVSQLSDSDLALL